MRSAVVLLENGTEESQKLVRTSEASLFGAAEDAKPRTALDGQQSVLCQLALVPERARGLAPGGHRQMSSGSLIFEPLLEWIADLDGEFDPGSGRTLAACLTHASRTRSILREKT